jgi:LlaJI restriction endonuclease
MNKLNSKFSIYLDKSSAFELPREVFNELSRRELILQEGNQKISFCGLLMVNKRINVFLPRASEFEDLSESQRVDVSATILKAIEKYGRDKNTKVDLKDEYDGNVGLSQLSLIRRLIEDFRQDGIYSRRRIIRKINTAKPDWKRTISKSSPFLNDSGLPVYFEIHSNQKKYSTDSEISRIHASIIKELDEQYSWIITGKNTLIAPQLNDYPSPPSSITYQINLLKSELHQAYADRDIRLLRGLINYLENQSGVGDTNFIAGVKDFHFAWEHMLREVLIKKIDLNSVLPSPTYIDTLGNFQMANEKSMRTDIILEEPLKKIVAVIDAKYYAATSHENSPGWPDLVKQFFYAKAVKLVRPDFNIRNYFVFPRKNGPLSLVKVRDRVGHQIKFFDDEFSPINCIYVCPLDVVTHYAQGKKMPELSNSLLN